MTEEDKIKEEKKQKFAKPDSQSFRSHYFQKRRKERKKRNEEEI